MWEITHRGTGNHRGDTGFGCGPLEDALHAAGQENTSGQRNTDNYEACGEQRLAQMRL